MGEMSVTVLRSVLSTRRLGQPALYYPQVGSTNDIALEMARAGAPDGLVVYTDEQTAGRGRLDRSWWAPPATCLLMSLLLRAPLPLHLAGQLTMSLGLGAVEAIEQVSGVRSGLKWPNDLVLDERKLGGMLAELATDGDQLMYAVLGLGLNVNIHAGTGPDALPSELEGTATSLLIATGANVNRLALLAAVLERTEVWYDRVRGGESIHAEWLARLDTLGRRVRISGTGGQLEGVAVGATVEGGLVVRDDAGTEHTVWSGDVVAVRPA
jgi:BirA family transcriptional regulator, biotin operon repressor / biotin---[acetyl-CoA-carboxylase] ligase